jgi:hypothetical protein
VKEKFTLFTQYQQHNKHNAVNFQLSGIQEPAVLIQPANVKENLPCLWSRSPPPPKKRGKKEKNLALTRSPAMLYFSQPSSAALPVTLPLKSTITVEIYHHVTVHVSEIFHPSIHGST